MNASDLDDPAPDVDGPETASQRDLIALAQPLLPLVLGVVASITAVLTIAERVLNGSRFQYFDYWNIINSTISDSGSFQFSNLLVLQNEHPVALARILYYANFRAFGGSNISLGVIVMAVVGLQVLILLRNAPFQEKVPRLSYAFAVVALLFATGGVHNFQFAMSGAAWLTANLLVMFALHSITRGRTTVAVISGVIASASYGTGLLVWPPLMVLALIQPVDRLKPIPVVAAGWILSWGVYTIFLYEPSPSQPLSFSPAGLVFRATSTLGAAFSDNAQIAILFGVLLIGVGAFAATHTESLAKAPISLGLAIYGALSASLISLSRGSFGDAGGIASRYVSLSAILTIGVLGLFAVGFPRPALTGLTLLALVASLAGTPRLAQYDAFEVRNLEASVAARLATGEGYRPTFSSTLTPKLQQIGHYPFNDSFDLDCGLLGETVGQIPPNQSENPRLLLETVSPDPELRRFEGFVGPNQPLPECLLVLAGDTVVGIGNVGGTSAAADEVVGRTAFVALMPIDAPAEIRIAGRIADGSFVDYGWN